MIFFWQCNHSAVDSQYIAVMFDMIVHTAQQLQWWIFGQIRTHERHTIPPPYGLSMGCLSQVVQRKMVIGGPNVSDADFTIRYYLTVYVRWRVIVLLSFVSLPHCLFLQKIVWLKLLHWWRLYKSLFSHSRAMHNTDYNSVRVPLGLANECIGHRGYRLIFI